MTRLGVLALAAGLLGAAAPPAAAWSWSDDAESTVLPSLQEEFKQEQAAYRSRVEKGMANRDRVIALDNLISTYKPQGINTAALESERDRLIVEEDKKYERTSSVQKLSSELFQLTLQKGREGRFEDALRAIQKAERLVPEDKSFSEMRRKLEGVTTILPTATANSKSQALVRKGVSGYLENEGIRALNALRYAQQLSPQPTTGRLIKLVENEHPEVDMPPLSYRGTLVDYKLQLAVQYVLNEQYLKAVNECNEVLDLEPDNVLALTRLGSAYYAMGQKEQAQETWTRALKIDPGNKDIKAFLRRKFSTSGT